MFFIEISKFFNAFVNFASSYLKNEDGYLYSVWYACIQNFLLFVMLVFGILQYMFGYDSNSKIDKNGMKYGYFSIYLCKFPAKNSFFAA